MRVLVICALALAVAGCSRPLPPQSAVPCIDLSGRACMSRPSAGKPVVSPPPGHEAVRHGRHMPAAVVRHRPARHHARIAVAERSRRPHAGLARAGSSAAQKTAPDRSAIAPIPAARDGRRAEPQVDNKLQAGTRPQIATKAEASKVQEEVGVAANLAERMTAIGAKPAGPAAKTEPDSHLVAVLMTRPSVKVLPDLRGKNIAIDERYAASFGKVATAIEAAGAHDVQLVDGRGTAINRLTNGEVSAAVVALVSQEAADAFPQLAGFKLFQVPLPGQ